MPTSESPSTGQDGNQDEGKTQPKEKESAANVSLEYIIQCRNSTKSEQYASKE
jgi:hypothetical protein